MADVVRETERKYEAADDTRLPDLGVKGVAAVTESGETLLEAVYYDTEDGRLAAAGMTLRRRTGGDDEGWHLKLPVGRHVREEVRAPLTDTPPRALTRLVRSRVRTAALMPVMELTTRRRVHRLGDADGAVLAEVARDRVTATRPGHGEDGTATWTEIEAELHDGRPKLLDRIEKRLRAAGLRPARSASKLQRALQETAPTTAARADHAPGTPGAGAQEAAPDTAGHHVLAYVRTQVEALVALDPAVRRHQPDSIHQMRVAARRLRSCFRSYRSVLDRRATDPLGTELRRLAAELGHDRDREVLLARLTDHLGRLPRGLRLGPVSGRLRTYDRARRGGSRNRVTAVLDGDRYLALLDALHALLAAPPLKPAADKSPQKILDRAVRRDTGRLSARIRHALALPPGEERDRALHEARKAAKRARYAAEVAHSALGGRAAKHVKRMKAVQQLLGEHQDAVVTRQALRDLALQAHDAGEPSFTYGVLHARESALATEYELRLAKLWRSVTERGHY
ncbi:CYTH and CHAD domain-containing protein [Streptomyces sp. RKND-216]|uniref:CYTH and CHAD domain-containing protein n=1 Tax=Streptomyces sp. RKND-216 TaxID=2562581 RepID=UPI00109DCE47|nr:CYTH and CHAD domain-containing protein [Streptomyces sp. RKND-216]THA26426.1 CYTH and CHAD domain-containing protein [Streptomyces sp. RKND-216]